MLARSITKCQAKSKSEGIQLGPLKRHAMPESKIDNADCNASKRLQTLIVKSIKTEAKMIKEAEASVSEGIKLTPQVANLIDLSEAQSPYIDIKTLQPITSEIPTSNLIDLTVIPELNSDYYAEQNRIRPKALAKEEATEIYPLLSDYEYYAEQNRHRVEPKLEDLMSVKIRQSPNDLPSPSSLDSEIYQYLTDTSDTSSSRRISSTLAPILRRRSSTDLPKTAPTLRRKRRMSVPEAQKGKGAPSARGSGSFKETLESKVFPGKFYVKHHNEPLFKKAIKEVSQSSSRGSPLSKTNKTEIYKVLKEANAKYLDLKKSAESATTRSVKSSQGLPIQELPKTKSIGRSPIASSASSRKSVSTKTKPMVGGKRKVQPHKACKSRTGGALKKYIK